MIYSTTTVKATACGLMSLLSREWCGGRAHIRITIPHLMGTMLLTFQQVLIKDHVPLRGIPAIHIRRRVDINVWYIYFYITYR